jgi:hypothetical protein
VTLAMHAGAFVNNAGFYPPNGFTGGMAIVGGQTSPSGSTSRNEVVVSLWGTTFEGQAVDVSAWGANTTGTAVSGTSNRVSVDLNGVSRQAITSAVQSNPLEPAGTNVATIVR